MDLEFFCGDYGEFWEAMISLAVEYGVELRKRPESWFCKQERQQPVRDAIDRVRYDHLRRRLFRWSFEPSLLRIENPDERGAEAALLTGEHRDDAESLGVRLLRDIRSTFDAEGAERMTTGKLLEQLLKWLMGGQRS